MDNKRKNAAIQRNPYALHASKRKATRFKDRRSPRGGQVNKQRDYLEGGDSSP